MHHKSKQRQKAWDDGVAPSVNDLGAHFLGRFFSANHVLHTEYICQQQEGQENKKYKFKSQCPRKSKSHHVQDTITNLVETGENNR